MQSEISDLYTGSVKADDTGDPFLPVQMQRGYGRTDTQWKKKVDHLVTALLDGDNRLQAVLLL